MTGRQRGGYIAYSMNGRNGVSSVYIWSAEENKNYRVTPEMFNAGGPTWDPSGGYLYFVSNREFAPQIAIPSLIMRLTATR
ncbi:MAG: PD40 domain-containing protein [Chloracidobacterium sp.]|nr:PD40 domain-containing protein [Chloracidobacterium sp.]